MITYCSKSKNAQIEVDGMNRFHLANAIKKLIREDASPAIIEAMTKILIQKNTEAEANGEEIAPL